MTTYFSSIMKDLKADRLAKPSKDPEQNYNLTSTLEMGGYTTIEFNRKKNTGDTNDTLFEVRLYRRGICNNFHDLITPENSWDLLILVPIYNDWLQWYNGEYRRIYRVWWTNRLYTYTQSADSPVSTFEVSPVQLRVIWKLVLKSRQCSSEWFENWDTSIAQRGISTSHTVTHIISEYQSAQTRKSEQCIMQSGIKSKRQQK